MQAAERGLIRGVTRVKDAVEDWVRGYSKQDTLNNQRLVSGDITPEDRDRFKRDRIVTLHQTTTMPTKQFEMGVLNTPLPFNLTDEIAKIEALPNEAVDELIMNQATLRLGFWVRPQQK